MEEKLIPLTPISISRECACDILPSSFLFHNLLYQELKELLTT